MVNKLVLHVATNKCSPEQRRSTSCLLKKVIFDENSSVTHVVFYMNTTGKECPVFTKKKPGKLQKTRVHEQFKTFEKARKLATRHWS